jgi:hypothetical protein
MNVPNLNLQNIILGLALLQLLSLIIIIFLWVALFNVKRKMKRLFKGSKIVSLEDLIIQNQEKIHTLQGDIKRNQDEVKQLHLNLAKQNGRLGVVRYNAFSEQGSDLSFSIAMIDDHKTGVVITGIHNREQTYMYAKPINEGESSYTLSPEEKNAIQKAIQNR